MRLPWHKPQQVLGPVALEKRDRVLVLAEKVEQLAVELQQHTGELLEEIARATGQRKGGAR